MFIPKTYYEHYKELGLTIEEIIIKWKTEIIIRNSVYGMLTSEED